MCKHINVGERDREKDWDRQCNSIQRFYENCLLHRLRQMNLSKKSQKAFEKCLIPTLGEKSSSKNTNEQKTKISGENSSTLGEKFFSNKKIHMQETC